jgi:hypothetical protein
MWSCLLLTDAATESVSFSGLTLVPAGDPIALLAAIERTGAEHILIAAPRSLSDPLATGLTVATGRRPGLRLSALSSDHAPLAILSALASAQPVTDQPALGVALVYRLLADSWSGAWTSSVARLTRPVPQLRQHLRSLLPGASFLLRQEPGPAVLGDSRDDDVPGVGFDRVLLVQDGAVPGPIAQRLAAATGVSTVRQVSLPGRWTSVYGTDRTGQLALVPAEPQRLLASASHRCPSCRLGLAAEICPFCRILGHQVTQVAQAAHVGGRL